MSSLTDRALYSVDKECNILEKCEIILKFLHYSEEEVFKIAYDIDNINVIMFIPNLSVEDRVKCLSKIGEKHNHLYDTYISRVLSKGLCKRDPDVVLECLKYYQFDNSRYETIKRIKDEYKRLLGMNSLKLKSFFVHYENIVNGVKNKDNLRKAYNEGNLNVDAKKAIILIMDDEFKEQHLNDFKYEDRFKIIMSLKNSDLKKKYVLSNEYSEFQAEILSTIQDEEFVIRIFKEKMTNYFQLKLIMLIDDNKLKNKLLEFLRDTTIKDVLKSNLLTKDEKNKIKPVVIPLENVDDKITFGVELECCGGDSCEFLLIENILKTWHVTLDESVDRGIEVISPVLKFDNNSLRELQYICNVLNKGEFYTDERCGGHIHFGFNYFSNVQEFDTFLKFYCAIENLLFVLSNKSGSVSRSGINEYAQKFSHLYSQNGSFTVYADNIKKLGRYTKLVRDIPRSRYYALNIKNIGTKEKNTIEFRMPNGEIDFNELLLNILLFAKVMEKSKELNNLLNNKNKDIEKKQLLEKYHVILNTSVNSSDRVKLLIDILFENDSIKDAYLERYYKNVQIKNNKVLRRQFIENNYI